MIVKAVEFSLYAPWVHSLKEKRMEIKSLIAKIKNTFNVSVIESGSQDIHQTLIIGVACAGNTVLECEQILDKVAGFLERNSEAEIVNTETIL